MNIQIISYNPYDSVCKELVTNSSLDSFESLDNFYLNIVNLRDPSIWRSDGFNADTIPCINDFSTISKSVARKQKTRVVYVLPPNLDFPMRASGSSVKIKDMLEKYWDLMSKVLPQKIDPKNYLYGKVKTHVGLMEYNSDFYFSGIGDSKTITCSDISHYPTTIRVLSEIYITTLDIMCSDESFTNFVNSLFYKDDADAPPDWMSDIEFFNDKALMLDLEKKQSEIAAINEQIAVTNSMLKDNEIAKSVLYTNGDQLVKVVFMMLEKLLSCDLADFNDEKKEDFLIKKEGCTFIGEIKGITSNVKNENITQLELHYQGYMDKLQEDGVEEIVHQILIINPLRNKPLNEREPVHDKQIRLAERNGCLIVTTFILLKMYEKFLKEDLSSDKCIEVFSSKTGLLSVEDF